MVVKFEKSLRCNAFSFRVHILPWQRNSTLIMGHGSFVGWWYEYITDFELWRKIFSFFSNFFSCSC